MRIKSPRLGRRVTENFFVELLTRQFCRAETRKGTPASSSAFIGTVVVTCMADFYRPGDEYGPSGKQECRAHGWQAKEFEGRERGGELKMRKLEAGWKKI